MNAPRRRLCVLVLLLAASFAVPRAADAAGVLVKGTTSTAVYYLASDGKRYVFPNEKTFMTWYADFSSVIALADADLAAIPIGGNVTYRPGHKLVKIATDSRTYAVAKGGVLRHLVSPAVVAELYGPDWARSVEDVPEVFFGDYAVGTPVGSASQYYPDGERAVPSIDADLGVASSEEPVLPSVPTFSLEPVPSSVIVGTQMTLLQLRLATPVPLTLRKLPVRLNAFEGLPFGSGADADAGGLVRGSGIEANLSGLRLLDADGRAVFGVLELSLDTRKDQEQLLEFGGSFAVPVGTTVLRLVADGDGDAPPGDPYRASVPVSRIELAGTDGAPRAFLPGTDLVGNVVTTGSDLFTVSAEAIPLPTASVRGEDAVFGAFVLRAPAARDVTVRSLAFQGFLDEQEGIAGFLPGGDADDGTETRLRDLVGRLRLVEKDGGEVRGEAEVDFAGRASFSGMAIPMQAGTYRTFYLRGVTNRDAAIGSHPDLVAFDVGDVERDAFADDAQGSRVAGEGEAPNGGASPRHWATLKERGMLTFSWFGNVGNAVVGRDIPLGALEASAKDDAFALKTLSIVVVEGTDDLARFRALYVDADGRRVERGADLIGNTVAFTGLDVPVPHDDDATVTFYADLKAVGGEDAYGERVRTRFAADRLLGFESKAEGRAYGEAELARFDEFSVASSRDSDQRVMLTGLSAERPASTPTGEIRRGATEPVLRFTLAAEPEGRARVRKMAFRLIPGDAGTEGADNDSLERWADVNGDFYDDNGILDLRRMTPGGGYELVAEGIEGSVRYGVIRHGTRDMTPSDLVSEAGDAGYLEIDLTGSELVIPAGTKIEFELALKTDVFVYGGKKSLKVELLGGADFLWTDDPDGFFEPIDGNYASGLLLASPELMIP